MIGFDKLGDEEGTFTINVKRSEVDVQGLLQYLHNERIGVKVLPKGDRVRITMEEEIPLIEPANSVSYNGP